MDSAAEILQLTKEINQTKIRLGTINLEILNLEREIGLLEALEVSLRQNITELKKKKVITLALEFKKAKYNLNQTLIRLAFLKSQLKDLNKSYVFTETVLENCKKEYELLLNPPNNVIFLKKDKKDE
jgi:chromosome segregation ATPase